jgi:hypothetical protein
MTCPFCDSEDVELISPWGGQIITSQMRCRACNTYFEAIRDEFGSSTPEDPQPTFPGESGSIPEVSRDRSSRIPLREFGSVPWPDADDPKPNSPWTTSSADDR